MRKETQHRSLAKKLRLNRQTIRKLSQALDTVQGGTFRQTFHPTICPGPVCTGL